MYTVKTPLIRRISIKTVFLGPKNRPIRGPPVKVLPSRIGKYNEVLIMCLKNFIFFACDGRHRYLPSCFCDNFI